MVLLINTFLVIMTGWLEIEYRQSSECRFFRSFIIGKVTTPTVSYPHVEISRERLQIQQAKFSLKYASSSWQSNFLRVGPFVCCSSKWIMQQWQLLASKCVIQRGVGGCSVKCHWCSCSWVLWLGRFLAEAWSFLDFVLCHSAIHSITGLR